MKKDANSLNWFEIPAKDMRRAKKFYENIFAIKMDVMDFQNMSMASFPSKPGSGKANGALVKSKFHKPSKTGAVVYLNANPRLEKVLDKIPKAGGKVVIPKTQIGEWGYMACFIDSEGNQVALHSNK